VIETALAMNAAGINVNKSGNVSARCARGPLHGFVVTPTAVPYWTLEPSALVFVSGAGDASGAQAPSSEWRFHRDIYAARAEFAAIVHTHSVHATALACHGRGLPAFHYMVASAGGEIRCAPYATFGTQALSDQAVQALAERRACLLAHHGVIACGSTLDEALALGYGPLEARASSAHGCQALRAGHLGRDLECVAPLREPMDARQNRGCGRPPGAARPAERTVW
jgi:L-fuculose-phosphate aldolase